MDLEATESWAFRRDLLRATENLGLTVDTAIASLARDINHQAQMDWAAPTYFLLAEALPELSTQIITQLCSLGVQVDHLADLIANPEATRADELYRRAVKAFSFDWLEEAASDAERTLDADPYHFGAHYLLGRIATIQHRNLEAASSFQRAAKYALPFKPDVAATAALAGIHCYRGPGGNIDSAIELGTRTLAKLSVPCPVLQFAVGRLTGIPEDISRALLADPGLLPTAMVINLPHLQKACEGILQALSERVEGLLGLCVSLHQECFSPLIQFIEPEISRRTQDPINHGQAQPNTQELCRKCGRFSIWADVWPECGRTVSYDTPRNSLTETSGLAVGELITQSEARISLAASSPPITRAGMLAGSEMNLYYAARLSRSLVGWLRSDSGRATGGLYANIREMEPILGKYSNELYRSSLPKIIRVGENDSCPGKLSIQFTNHRAVSAERRQLEYRSKHICERPVKPFLCSCRVSAEGLEVLKARVSRLSEAVRALCLVDGCFAA